MPRRLSRGVVHSACHAPSALACAVRPHSEEFISGFQSHTALAYGREGVQDKNFLPPPRRKRETKRKALVFLILPDFTTYNLDEMDEMDEMQSN
ncbi:hypothetical protein EVAR_73015_1 [Eumeta japonica]|uniref:Uncharacterized protein n=1 Tax=Eumeta variegata TaxID=151549 RepID=A0A4C2ABX0_EUMVA|nr:hypothetical protein EVAR_73015_1 [Eumeta japonica]